jgi:hypothetical protein
MHKIKEVLRLKWESKLSQNQIAASCQMARSTVGEYVQRAQAAGLSWPPPKSSSFTKTPWRKSRESCSSRLKPF